MNDDYVLELRREFYAEMAVERSHMEPRDPLYLKPPVPWRERVLWVRRCVWHVFRPEMVKVVDRPARREMHAVLTGLTA